MARSRPPSDERHHHHYDATEQTPLLSGEPPAADATTEAAITTAVVSSRNVTPKAAAAAADDDDDDKPLPVKQILILCYARMMEPIAFFSIFPFIAQMVERNGKLPVSDVGFYSGLIESLFSATLTLVLIFWGRLADRVGRKPVLILTLVGTAIGPVLFCMAQTLAQMIIFRCLAGVFSGSSLIIRTMIGDHTTPKTQARAFSWFAFSGNVGILLGPIIGGALADPITQYPRVFKRIAFFEQFPYALSGFVVGLISITSAIVSIFFLEETLPKETSRGDDSEAGAPAAVAPSMWQLFKSPGVGFALWLHTHVMLLAFVFTAIMPVVLFTPVSLGGLGLDTSLITAYMAVQGASQALWLLVAFPWLHRRFGNKRLLELCGTAYPFFFAGYILLNTLLREGSDTARVWFWIIGVFVAAVGPGVSMAFTGVQLAVNDVSPDPHVLGTLNALALTLASGVRSFAPAVATVIYAVGVRNQIFAGHLAMVLMIPLALVFTVGARWTPERKVAKQPAGGADDAE